MLDHHIQRSIVYKLALASRLRFSELMPDTIDNKLFTYHLKKVVAAGFVVKTSDGQYQLTPKGRRLGVHVLDNSQALMDRAYSVLFLAVRRKTDNAWLLYKRRNHPLRGKVGFMHATPTATEEVAITAERMLLDKTGLSCKFRPLGGGYFRIFEGGKLESFTHFTLLVGEDAIGELKSTDKLADYYWTNKLDVNDPELLPNMPLLIEYYDKAEVFFLDETLNI